MKKRQDPGLSIPGIKNEFDGGCICVSLPARQLLQSSLLVFLLHHPVLRVAARGECTSLLVSLSLPNAMVSNTTRVVAGTNFTASTDLTSASRQPGLTRLIHLGSLARHSDHLIHIYRRVREVVIRLHLVLSNSHHQECWPQMCVFLCSCQPLFLFWHQTRF